MPGLEEVAATAPSVVAAAAGASPGWRRASLFVEQDDYVSAIGQTGLPCLMWTVITGPAAGNALFFDDAATMDVDRKITRLNSSNKCASRLPSCAFKKITISIFIISQ